MFFLKGRYLIFYAVISVILFVILLPFSNIIINRILADLTQDLIVQEVNPVRKDFGLLDLNINDKLSRAARMKAQDMVDKDYFSHVGPNGETPWSWLDKVGYNYAAAGENLAIDANDPVLLVSAWLNSPSHAKNILNGYFTDIGLGIIEGEIKGKKTTVVVMFLGREKTAHLEMASGITDEYEQIVISEVERNTKPPGLIIVEDHSLASVRPEDTVVVKKVEEEDLYKENLLLAAAEQSKNAGGLIKKESNNNRLVFQMFLTSDFPELFRLFLTALFSGLVLLGMVRILLSKKRNASILSSGIFILFLVLLIWLPDLI